MESIFINYENLHLTRPCVQYMASYRHAIAEHNTHGVEDFAYPKVDTRREVAAFLKKVDRFHRGIDIPRGYVPGTSFWLVDGKHYLGSGDIRHYLNDNLRKLGGNIGYSIRPSVWRNGLGSLQLALLLREAAKLRVYRPIITCFDGNVASAKIIEKNGGVLLKKINNNFRGRNRLTRIYEIDLTQQDECGRMIWW